ncbi:MAG TPA: transcriptional repressor [Anaerovoracaceae bacterium]|nr:transcriptional repressor [Anaerovoracaceae bacterium]
MKYSKQRGLILRIVKDTTVHPTAEWVYSEAKKEMPSIGVATVYRNLNNLEDMGEIIRITTPGRVDRFDGKMEKHYHMTCVKCGRLMDLDPVSEEAMHKMEETIYTTLNVNRNEAEVSDTLLKDVCSRCAGKEN